MHELASQAPAAQPLTPIRTVTVVYLAGYGRSGSTLLGQILGELPDCAFVGEANFFWSDGLSGRPCGCGLALRECPLWSKVIAALNVSAPEAAAVVALLDRSTRTRHGVARRIRRGPRGGDVDLQALGAHLNQLYLAIADVFGVDVIVDSSKSPMYLEALAAAPNVRLETVHLVRDPRASAHSWRTPKSEPVGSSSLPQYGLLKSTALWTVTNALSHHVGRASGRYFRLHYEALMRDPIGQLTALGHATGRDLSPVTDRLTGAIELGVSHSIAGNPGRFTTGSVQLRSDERWRSQLSPAENAVVQTLTFAPRRLFGYDSSHRAS